MTRSRVKVLSVVVNAVSLGSSDKHQYRRHSLTRSMKVTGVWGFFTYHTCCILNIRHQITNVWHAFKKRCYPKYHHRTVSSPTSIVSLLLMHMPLLHNNTLTDCESGVFSSAKQTHKTFFKCCTLIMIQLGPRESMNSTICATTGGESWDGVITSCAVHWPFLTVPLSSLGS